MDQLELRSYPRAEIAKVLSVNINDSKHFKRNVEHVLKKWGYGFRYEKPAVKILSKPETAGKRLAEILIRELGIDVQIKPIQFAYFIIAFRVIDGFNSMPWEERAAAYYKQFNILVSDRTMRNWCSRLIAKGIIYKFGDRTAWKTSIIGGKKFRSQVQEDEEEEMNRFFDRRWELVEEKRKEIIGSGFPPKEAKKAAWDMAYKELWDEFSCCYYYCKDFCLTAFSEDNDTLYEIYELVEELAAVPPAASGHHL